MLRMLKRLPNLQRKLTFLLFTFVIGFLVYLISSVHEDHFKRATSASGALPDDGQSFFYDKGKVMSKLKNLIKNENAHVQDLSSKIMKPPTSTLSKLSTSSQTVVLQPTQPPIGAAGGLPVAGLHPVSPLVFKGPGNDEQRQIRDAFMHGWNAYKKFAWGHDELRPLSQGYNEWFNLGLTIVDSLSTMYIMGLNAEFKLARDWVAKDLKLDQNHNVQLFEVVIRELGGLISAYYLSGDKVFLEKARELGNRLLPCFNGNTKIPCRFVNLQTGHGSFAEISTAESGTVQLEFRALSRATGDPKYEQAIEGVSNHLHNMKKLDGLVSCFINALSGKFRQGSTVSFGASADSYYEYLLKQWLQTGKTRDVFKTDYKESIAGMRKHLLRETIPNKLLFVGALYSAESPGFRSDMEHLTCFVPGMLALGSKNGLGDEDLQLAKRIAHTCVMMYFNMPTGLSPEVANMNTNSKFNKEDMFVGYGASYNLQRPETVESLYYLYKITGDNIYRQWGWKIFQAFEKYAKLTNGYASIHNVKIADRPNFKDKMETFYLAETLKYLYLLFEDDPNVIPLDKFVFNTEAHPLPIYRS